MALNRARCVRCGNLWAPISHPKIPINLCWGCYEENSWRIELNGYGELIKTPYFLYTTKPKKIQIKHVTDKPWQLQPKCILCNDQHTYFLCGLCGNCLDKQRRLLEGLSDRLDRSYPEYCSICRKYEPLPELEICKWCNWRHEQFVRDYKNKGYKVDENSYIVARGKYPFQKDWDFDY